MKAFQRWFSRRYDESWKFRLAAMVPVCGVGPAMAWFAVAFGMPEVLATVFWITGAAGLGCVFSWLVVGPREDV